MDNYIFNPLNNKNPKGASKAGSGVVYTLKVSHSVDFTDIFFVLIDDKSSDLPYRIKMPLISDSGNYYTYEISLQFDNAGLFWYYFEIQQSNGSFYLCKSQGFNAEAFPDVRQSFAQVVFESESTVDKEINRGIIYHIFVDRFKKSGSVIAKDGMILRTDWGGELTKNSNNFTELNQECFGGNLQGIIDKLDYIKSLGTSMVYLSPIFESYSNHKYDTADFEHVDSMFGGDETFDALMKAASAEKINIVLDGVFNHVGSDSIYFNKLGRFNETGAFGSRDSKYYNWFMFDDWPLKYSSWWGIETLPQLNESDGKLQNFIAGPDGIVTKWMEKGIAGFRLDVVDELNDVYLDKICKRIKSVKPDALILGEVWEDAATKIAYGKRRSYFLGHQLNSVTNYPLRNAIIDFVCNGNAETLEDVFCMMEDHYPTWVRNNLMNFLGSHDTKRILSVLQEKDDKNAIQLLKIASAIQYCAPGIPAVFYGDEIGLKGGDAPLCRVCYPWGQENKEILDWYKRLGELRRHEVFISGNCKVILAHAKVFIFERTHKNSRIIVAANCGNEDFKLNLSTSFKDFETGKVVKDFVSLRPLQFVILFAV